MTNPQSLKHFILDLAAYRDISGILMHIYMISQ